MVTSGTPNPPARWTFSYTTQKGQQLNTITVPSPTGTGNSTATINYDAGGKVTSLVDANGNQRIYTYNSSTTLVQVKDAANNLALSWTQKFDSSKRDTGITDAANHSTTIAYTDARKSRIPHPWLIRDKPQIGFSQERWNEYRDMFSKLGLKGGLAWSRDHSIFLTASAKGLTIHGSEKGYVFSAKPLSPTFDSLDDIRQEIKNGKVTPGLPVYRKIKEGWYLYYEGD